MILSIGSRSCITVIHSFHLNIFHLIAFRFPAQRFDGKLSKKTIH